MTARSNIFNQLHRFTKDYHSQALRVIGLGLLLATWDVAVPLGSGYVIDMILHHDPVSTILATLVLLFLFGWMPHGNILPYLLERYDLQHYRVPMLADLSIRALRATVGVSNGCRKQPILQQGRDNIARLAERCARELPMALRGVIIFLTLFVISRMFAPILIVACLLVVGVTIREFKELAPAYRLRQQAENIQRDLENEIDDARVPTLSGDDLWRLLDAHEVAVLVRAEFEIAVGRREIGYELARRIVFNLALLGIWAWAAVGVVRWDYSPVAFLAVTSYVLRVNELFGSIVGVMVEVLRIGASVDNLDRLVETLDSHRKVPYQGATTIPRQGKPHDRQPDHPRFRVACAVAGQGARLLQGGRRHEHDTVLRGRLAWVGDVVPGEQRSVP
jgi:ABC-type multidrug transport system fused ATPase/permease subunit